MSKYNGKWMVTANQTENIISTHDLKQSIKLINNLMIYYTNSKLQQIKINKKTEHSQEQKK
jgi:hypothetical protein